MDNPLFKGLETLISRSDGECREISFRKEPWQNKNNKKVHSSSTSTGEITLKQTLLHHWENGFPRGRGPT